MRCDLKSLQYRRRRRRVSAIIALAIEVNELAARDVDVEKRNRERIGPRTFISLARTESVFATVFSLFALTVMCLCLSLLVIAMSHLQNCSLSLSPWGNVDLALFTRVVCLKAEPAIHYYIIFHQPIRWGRLIFLHFLYFCASLNLSVCLST